MKRARLFFDALNREYLQLLRAEGELYWTTHTGQSDAHEALASATLSRKLFSGDQARLAQVREHLARLPGMPESSERNALIQGLQGWYSVLESNAINTERAAHLLSELTQLDADLFARRRLYKMTHVVSGRVEEATPAALRNNLASNPDESARRSSHVALQGLEHWVLNSGFLDVVAKRNALARESGFSNFFEYRLSANSGMTSEALFAIFDAFEQATRKTHQEALHRLARQYGSDALLPCNLSYRMRGETTHRADAYHPFPKALERWAESFRRMGISFRGARLEMDLLDRPGKFPTGFCIAPTPGYRDDTDGQIPADVRFTSTARPQQAGAGLRGLNVLFHEAGHAAHFANVRMNSPCFSQEFPPSSPALLEAQAKFFDALPADPCWLKRYAVDSAGNPMPDELIRAQIEMRQTWLAYGERRDLVPTYFERGLYEMSDAERTPEAVLALAKSITERILGIPDHTDYVLSIPHPIYHDIAVYYHGYLLAKMAAAQTRAYLLRAFGFIVDNPAVGPLLSEHYWAPGNRITLDQALVGLTGESLNPAYLAAECNRSAEDAWDGVLKALGHSEDAAKLADSLALDVSIAVVHGGEKIAGNEESLSAMYEAFERWISTQEYSIQARA